MDFFGNIKIGTWFSQFNSWHIFKKVDENFAVSSNGELIAFTPNEKAKYDNEVVQMSTMWSGFDCSQKIEPPHQNQTR